MTTIAFDGSVLAADDRVTFGSTAIGGYRKIFEASGCRLGMAGDYSSMLAFEAYALGTEAVKPAFPDLWLMFIAPDNRIYEADGDMRWVEVKRRHWAIGSGAPYALGAMAHGASAAQAVIVAAMFDNCTSTNTQTL